MLAHIYGPLHEVIHKADRLIEAPNWSPEGRYLLVNAGGRLCKPPVEGSALEPLPTRSVTGMHNDHGISPDGG